MQKYISFNVILSVLLALMIYELVQPYYNQGIDKLKGH